MESQEGAEKIREPKLRQRGKNVSPPSGDRVSQRACSPARDAPSGVTSVWGAAVVIKARFLRDTRKLGCLAACGIGAVFEPAFPAPRRHDHLRAAGIEPGQAKGLRKRNKANVYLEPKWLR